MDFANESYIKYSQSIQITLGGIMFKRFVIMLIVLLMSVSIITAQENTGLQVDEMVICTSLEERQPVGADTAFAKTVGQLYCYTKISGSVDTTTVSHVWYFAGEEKARVELSVKAKKWRTWSSKRIVEEWAGKWKVDVVSASGNILKSKEFVVK